MKNLQELSKSRVFVVHSRNDMLRRALFDFLRAIDLKPIEWSEAVDLTGNPSPLIGDVLDAAMGYAQAIVVQVGKLRSFSDIAGRHFIRLRNTSKSRQELAQRLKLAGCDVDLAGTDWHDAGSFPNK